MVGGVFALVRLSEKSITEWNEDNYYEKDWITLIIFLIFLSWLFQDNIRLNIYFQEKIGTPQRWNIQN